MVYTDRKSGTHTTAKTSSVNIHVHLVLKERVGKGPVFVI